MQSIFQNYLGQMSEQEDYKFSIIPILTQVDPSDEDFDFDIFKENFSNILKNELDKQFPGFEDDQEEGDKKKDNNKKKNVDDEDDMDEDDDFHSKNRRQVKQFFDAFVKNIIVFDPLDRDIMTPDDDGEDQVINTKSADLK